MIDAITIHVPIGFACTRVGISYETHNEWYNKGKKHQNQPQGRYSEYVTYFLAVEKAAGDAVASGVGRIQQAARGGNVLERTTKTIRKADGSTETITTEKVARGEWTADAWMLERTRPEHFAQNRGEIKALERELAEAHALIDGLLASMAAKIGDQFQTPNSAPPLILSGGRLEMKDGEREVQGATQARVLSPGESPPTDGGPTGQDSQGSGTQRAD